MTGRILLLLSVAAFVALDLATKTWATTLPREGLRVLPFLDLRLSFNSGVSFGLLAAEGVYGYVILLCLTVTVSLFFLSLAWGSNQALPRIAYGAIATGAFGNVLDRFPDGTVTDFIDVHAAGWHFPTFNLADVAISVGVGMLLFRVLMRQGSG